MKEMFLLKLGEIVLKGANRRTFEETLKKNVRRTVSHFGAFKVYIMQSTVYVEPQADDCDLDGAWEACGHVFGVSSMCRCRACEKNLDAIYQAVVDYLGDELSVQKSFKVESKRSDKSFPLNSIQISQEIGGRIAEAFPHVAVDVHTPAYQFSGWLRKWSPSSPSSSSPWPWSWPWAPCTWPCWISSGVAARTSITDRSKRSAMPASGWLPSRTTLSSAISVTVKMVGSSSAPSATPSNCMPTSSGSGRRLRSSTLTRFGS